MDLDLIEVVQGENSHPAITKCCPGGLFLQPEKEQALIYTAWKQFCNSRQTLGHCDVDLQCIWRLVPGQTILSKANTLITVVFHNGLLVELI